MRVKVKPRWLGCVRKSPWLGSLLITPLASLQAAEKASPDYFTVEGMRSQTFSVGIFIFLIIGILVFTGIVIMYMRAGKSKQLKTGEKVMFAWLFLGIVAAVILAALQLLGGQLL